ncbi:MAG: potassium channel protein [Longimicrobiales bacterium]
MSVHVKRFLWMAIFVAVILLIGTRGYMAIEGWGTEDSLYMALITMAAVGYHEVHPLSSAGRLFTGGILAAGITAMGFWFAFLTSFVVIERDRRLVEEFHETLPDLPIIEGDATVDHYLEEAGIARARGLIACLSADTDNLFVCLSARDLRKDIEIVARAFEEETVSKLYRAGADHVVSPNASGAIRMASFMLRPDVVSFLDVATRSPDLTLRLEQQTVGDSSPVVGQTLMDAQIPQNTGLIVIAVRKKNPEGSEEEYSYVYNPVGSTRLEPGDVMIVMGSPEQIRKLRTFVNP